MYPSVLPSRVPGSTNVRHHFGTNFLWVILAHQPTKWSMLMFCPVFTSFTREGKRGWGKKSCPSGLLLNPNGELACSLFPSPMEQNGSLDGACKRSLTDGPTVGMIGSSRLQCSKKHSEGHSHRWEVFAVADHQKFISYR